MIRGKEWDFGVRLFLSGVHFFIDKIPKQDIVLRYEEEQTVICEAARRATASTEEAGRVSTGLARLDTRAWQQVW